ncbi:MAG: response regulator [Phormidesmis sp.]
MRILLVEDDESVAKVLQKVLSDEHYAVDVAHDGHIGWQFVSDSHYDLVILDVLLPNLDGLEFCRRLRDRAYDMPVLLVTALDSSHKKIAGLNAGADDYITKPFELEELLARVKALLRRVKTSIVLILEWGDLRLEPNSREVTYQENSLSLTPKEYALLELFLRNPSQVFSRRAILDNLWSYSEAPGEETVTSHIKGLRRKLSDAGAPTHFIETVYGVGYRLREQSAVTTAKASQAEKDETAPRLDSQQENLSALDLQAERIRRQKTHAALVTLWDSVKFQQIERIELLNQAMHQLSANQLSLEARKTAYRAAHSLTGVLGIFGIVSGSDLAREVQGLLKGESPITPDQQDQLRSLIDQLGETINQAIHTSQPPNKSFDVPLLVLIDPQLDLAPALISNLWGKRLIVKVAPHIAALQPLLTAFSRNRDQQSRQLAAKSALPDVVLLNFSLKNTNPDQLAELSSLLQDMPSLMVLICSADGGLDSRRKAAQMGDYPFLDNPSAAEVVRGVEMLRSHPPHIPCKILAVDDDPQILSALSTYLEPQGFQIVTLNQPLAFWQTLKQANPDLLLLDISMPQFNGIELCQIVRQAPFWNHLPIVFFTSHADVLTQKAAFRAGANDVVEKSLPNSELSIHLHEQIKRSHLQQAIAVIADGTVATSS